MTKKEYRKCFRFFVTFPQSGDFEPEEIFKLWKDSDYHFKELAWVREKHEDGGDHIHWSFELKHSLTRKQVLDKFASVYPDDWHRIDVKSGKCSVNWMYENYCAKEGVPFYKCYKKIKSLWSEAEQEEWDRIGASIKAEEDEAMRKQVARSLEKPTLQEWLDNEEKWRKTRDPNWEWIDDINGGEFIYRGE